jgi:hypothetical protein
LQVEAGEVDTHLPKRKSIPIPIITLVAKLGFVEEDPVLGSALTETLVFGVSGVDISFREDDIQII